MWKKKHDPKSIVSISKDFGMILNPNYTYETIISDEDVQKPFLRRKNSLKKFKKLFTK